MRHVLIGAAVLALTPGLLTAQSSAGTARARAGTCEECPQDSVTLRIMNRQRLGRQDDVERLAKLTSELALVHQKLAGDQELTASDRRSLQLRARRLESQLKALESRFRLEIEGKRLKEIRPAMIDARRAMAAAIAAEAATASHEEGRFRGWIGITLDAPSTVEARGEDVYWRFLEHPRIVSVDPSSPAERAGIRQGDVLLAYNGRDVRREIAMNRLLRPGRTVRVRVRTQRDNDVRDVPVKVAPAPDFVWHGGSAGAPIATAKPRSPRPGVEVWRVPARRPGTDVVLEPRSSTAPVMSFATFSGLAGARMETITSGLGEAIGVERGVLVLSVTPGVPAHESGLVDGDVILRANGRDIATVRDLRTLMVSSGEKALTLDVSRKGKVRQVTLRW